MNNRRTTHPDADVTTNPELDRVWTDQSDELPPMAIDSTILTKAREEVASKHRRIGFLPASWVLPIGGALAAGLVLGVSLGTFKQQADAPEDAATAMSPLSVSEDAGIRSLARSPMPMASTKKSVVAQVDSTQTEEELEQALVKPLERPVPRAAAAQATVSRDDASGSIESMSVQAVRPKIQLESTKNKSTKDRSEEGRSPEDKSAEDQSIANAETENRVFVSPQRTTVDGGTAMSITASQIMVSQAPGNSKEAISDTLSEMLDEISDAQGNLNDRELDLLFATEESWTISIQRMLTNKNEVRALQLADKFQQRYPDAEIPPALQALFDRL